MKRYLCGWVNAVIQEELGDPPFHVGENWVDQWLEKWESDPMALRTLNTRSLRFKLMYNLFCIFSLMYSFLYKFFGNFYFPPLPLVAPDPVSGAHGNTCQI